MVQLPQHLQEAADTPEPVDNVNHSAHYTAYRGVEIIDLTEQMNFNRGNAVKYICRAGLKSPQTELEDLEKAAWYLQREISRVRGNQGSSNLKIVCDKCHRDRCQGTREKVGFDETCECCVGGHLRENVY